MPFGLRALPSPLEIWLGALLTVSGCTADPGGNGTARAGPADDCVGTTNSGCPGSVSTRFEKELPEMGESLGGSAFSDDCPSGSVLSGISFGMASWLVVVRGTCRTVKLALGSSAPSGYDLVLGEEAKLEPHGATDFESNATVDCPKDEVVVGLRTASQGSAYVGLIPFITKVWVSCAKLLVEKQGDFYVVHWSEKKEMPPAASAASNADVAFSETTAGNSAVVTRLAGASGILVDRLKLGVGKVVVAPAHQDGSPP